MTAKLVWHGLVAFIVALVATVVLGAASTIARAAAAPAGPDLNDLIRRAIGKNYPGARIELSGPLHWTQGNAPAKFSSIEAIGDDGKGVSRVAVRGEDGEAFASVAFSAWMPARVALRRIHPGEKIAEEDLVSQDINVASGMAREYRGVIVGAATPVNGLEARQTFLEGQFLVTSGVRKIPDVRRGDLVRIRMNAGQVSLSTQGTTEEPGYLGDAIRVMSAKTKRQLVGILREGGVVEVNL